MTVQTNNAVRIEKWDERGLDLLRRCNTPAMTEYIGGPESEQKLLLRHQRYLGYWNGGEKAWPFQAFVGDDVAASLSFWESEWDGQEVYEAGWATVPEFQGRGVATKALTLVLEHARQANAHRWVVAFPSRDNAASNAVCRRAGFQMFGPCEVEYPPGTTMESNDWRFDLRA